MSKLSEDDSSDSSDEFLVPADKLDLDSSFFNQPVKEPNQKPTTSKKKARVIESDAEDSEDDFDYSRENNVSSAELLSQVLKNLESVNNQFLGSNKNQSEASTSTSAAKSTNNDLSKEIEDLLTQGECQVTKDGNESDNEKETKEDIKKEYTVPEKGIEIHFPGENVMFDKKKKKQQDLQRMLQNKINQRIRSSQLLSHKVGLLCWISHSFFLNTLANDPDVMGFTTSLVSINSYPKDKCDLKYLVQFSKWFAGLFRIEEEFKQISYNKESLLQRVSDKKIYNYVELVLLFIAALRGMGINSRLVISLQPPNLKPTPRQLFKAPKDDDKNLKIKSDPIEVKPVKVEKSKKESQNKSTTSPQKKSTTSPTKVIKSKGRGRGRKCKISPVKSVLNTREADLTANEEAKKKAALFLMQFKATSSKGNKTILETHSPEKVSKFFDKDAKNDVSKDDNSSDDESYHDKLEKKKAANVKSNSQKNKDKKSETTEEGSSKSKRQTRQAKDIKHGKKKLSTSNEEFSEEEKKKDNEFSSDDEYVEKKPKKRVQKNLNQNLTIAAKLKKQRKMLSSDEDESSLIKKVHNVWAEVYIEAEEKWICVDVLGKKINCVQHMYQKAGQPVLYVVAWNSAGELKDVTRRYCPHWLTDTRKKRVDEKWWSGTLSHWKEKNTRMSRAEDEELLRRELEQPLPKTVSECKGHPLYAIARHLLKFEALYPPDCVPLGHLKTGEAIYSRHCVHTLMSRETWARKARVVKPAQEAYKVVKSLPKYDKLSGMKIKDQPLELFGKWQTDPYVPPEAKDGKVPRNDYGNVDLFKMSMLPKGTVWINLPALNRVARKLNIDCAPACVGFNFGCRGALPAFEGFVVCAEFEDTLRDAWERDQIDAEKRNKEKREKRIYGNWRKLIKGLLIRERLAAKYRFKENEEEMDVDNNEPIEEEEDLTTVQKKAMEKKTINRVTRATKRKKDEPEKAKKRIKT